MGVLSSVLNLTILLKADIWQIQQDSLIPIAVLLIWVQVFYWVRIFEQPAFYINLIERTLSDMSAFLIIVVLAISLFANLFYITN